MGESNTDFLAMEAMALARAAAPTHDTADGGKIVIVPQDYKAGPVQKRAHRWTSSIRRLPGAC